MRRMDRILLGSTARALAFLSVAGLTAISGAQEAKPTAATAVISLSEAIHRAQQNEPTFANAVAAQKLADVDRYLAKAALLPSVIYHNQVLYTQPNGQHNQAGQIGAQASPVFIANNAVREYASQAAITETIGPKQFADARVASANAARATAELEITRRGLVSTIVNLYYSVSAFETKEHLFADAFREAQSFTDLTQKREEGREVAHADVVKAQLQQQQRQRDLSDATLAADKARLELAVLLFPDPRTAYATEVAGPPAILPTRDEVNRLASTKNPEIRSALADVQAGNAGVASAKAAYLPDLGLNFNYGIDAPQFAKRGPDDVRNLGYSISGTVDIPVWDWFSTQKRVKQSEIQRDVAKVSLTAAQRRLIATLEEAYAEASVARDQLDLLDQSVRTAAESLRLTKLRYSAGESTALEVVDAQGAYLSAETAQADGVVRYQASLAGLQILTGTL
jgi:outer membrane protein TolC